MLSWTQVIEAVTLADFDILRDTRQDIWELKWAQPAHREAMNLHFQLKGACDEIKRLNVEIQRLLTFMIDDHTNYYNAIASQIIVNPTLASELHREWDYHQKINADILDRLIQTSRLPGFSGSLSYGCRIGRDPTLGCNAPLPWWADDIKLRVMQVDSMESGPTDSEGNESDNSHDMDDIEREANNIVDFMYNLAI
jgi:hypothetical protein